MRGGHEKPKRARQRRSIVPHPLTRTSRPSPSQGDVARALPRHEQPLRRRPCFSLCLFAGIIFDHVAIGIIAGLILGAGAGKLTAPKSDSEA